MFEVWKRIAKRWKSWVVIVIYQAPLEGDSLTPKQYIFYLRKNREVRGNESLAQKFWTERGAKTAGALLKLSGEIETVQDTYLGRNGFRFLEIRIERICGL